MKISHGVAARVYSQSGTICFVEKFYKVCKKFAMI